RFDQKHGLIKRCGRAQERAALVRPSGALDGAVGLSAFSRRAYLVVFGLSGRAPFLRRALFRSYALFGSFFSAGAFVRWPRLQPDAVVLQNLLLEASHQIRVLLQKDSGVVTPLTDAFAVRREPRSALLDQACVDPHVDHLTRTPHALAVKNVELDLAEGRRHLVLHDLHARAVTDDDHVFGPIFFDSADASHVEPHRRIELERIATGGRFRAAEHHPDLHPDLIGEEDQALRTAHGPGHLAERL